MGFVCLSIRLSEGWGGGDAISDGDSGGPREG